MICDIYAEQAEEPAIPQSLHTNCTLSQPCPVFFISEGVL